MDFILFCSIMETTLKDFKGRRAIEIQCGARTEATAALDQDRADGRHQARRQPAALRASGHRRASPCKGPLLPRHNSRLLILQVSAQTALTLSYLRALV